ncbi:MAG: SDR family NAD(P)-dependent oxidoreductase [Bacteroidetes bacterium]|nr:SDR family NAD(P)-dependent oxidoreductase [Bacteroidota bacterium]
MLKDRNIVLFGCSRGIGRALAREYARQGAQLVLLSRDVDAICDLSREITRTGTQSWYRRCDVSVQEDVRQAVAYACKCFGRIDVAVINAGIGSPEWMKDFRAEEFRRVLETNTFGIAHVLEELIPILRRQGYGVIAGVSSIADIRGFPGSAAYSSSKAAASRLLEAARVELHAFGIRVLTVRPGFVRTDMTAKNEFPMPFMISAERAARIIARGITRRKRIIHFPWPMVLLSRVVRLLPNAVFEAGARRTRPARSMKI